MSISGRSRWCRLRRKRFSAEIHSRIWQVCQLERLTALNTRTTRAAMNVSALVAGPSLRKIDTEFTPSIRDLRFTHRNEWPQKLNGSVGTEANGICHRLHELFAAIRVDGMITSMRSNDETFCR